MLVFFQIDVARSKCNLCSLEICCAVTIMYAVTSHGTHEKDDLLKMKPRIINVCLKWGTEIHIEATLKWPNFQSARSSVVALISNLLSFPRSWQRDQRYREIRVKMCIMYKLQGGY